MPQDRKANDAGAGARIPKAKKDDVEDVSWALSTSEAMWTRGDRVDALKWLRRAAEAASEAERDDRALELAKAAADLASVVDRNASVPPAPRASAPGPPPKSAPSKPAIPRAPPSSPSLSSSPTLKGPSPPRVAQVAAARAGTKAPLGPVAPATKPSTIPRKPSERPPKRPSGTNEVRRRRSSRPPPAEMDRATAVPDQPPATPRASVADDIDAWPTQSLQNANPAELTEEMTRIGVPAYLEEAKVEGSDADRALRASQAVRVIVWRSVDGVHVAPHGTTVSAITVDAMLVALDPSADLASWLGKK